MNKYVIMRDLNHPRMYWFSRGWSEDRRMATVYEGHAGEPVIEYLRRNGAPSCVLDVVGNSITHDQIIMSCGMLRGIAIRVEHGGSLDSKDIVFMKKFSADVMANEDAWIAAMKQQEEDASLAAIHAASWGPK